MSRLAVSLLSSSEASARPLLVVNPRALHNRLGSNKHGDRIFEMLARTGIEADVCAESDLAVVGHRVRAAVQAGSPLVIAAGGDGTIEAIAPALVHSSTALGVIPLGTYNNLAACLDIPDDLEVACELLATGVEKRIDVGEVHASNSAQRHFFLEQASIGLAPLLAPMGEGLQKGHWLEALRALPAALRLEPVPMSIRVNDEVASAETLLVTICNAPRSAAALVLAPDARMDDGQLDVCVYDGLHQAQLASMLFEFMSSGAKSHPGVRRALATSIEVHSTDGQRLLVAADAEVVGETPASFAVVAAALRVIVPPSR